MKIKILRSILIAGQPQNPGAIVEVSAHLASDLLYRRCAEIYVEAQPKVSKPKRKKNDSEHATPANQAEDASPVD
jgi:hypothetical protein